MDTPGRSWGYLMPQKRAERQPVRMADALAQLFAKLEARRSPVLQPDTPSLRADPELGRVCVCLYRAAEFRLYTIARDLTRQANGSGKVSRRRLCQTLEFYQITYSRRHLNRLFKAGDGLFWRLTSTHLYITNPGRAAALLAAKAPEHFSTNLPGVRDVYLSPSGSLEQWEAAIYAGWLTHRENPTISRPALEKLFNRSSDTLRRWEQDRLDDVVAIRTNYAQCPNPTGEFHRYLPDHSQPYLANVKFNGAWVQQPRVYWRLPNSYQTKKIRQHPHKGQASKVRKAVNASLDRPADRKRGGDHELRRYFDNAKHLKDFTARHGSIGYIWRGENRRKAGVFEINRNGFPLTYPKERASFAEEGMYFLIERHRVSMWLSSPSPTLTRGHFCEIQKAINKKWKESVEFGFALMGFVVVHVSRA